MSEVRVPQGEPSLILCSGVSDDRFVKNYLIKKAQN